MPIGLRSRTVRITPARVRALLLGGSVLLLALHFVHLAADFPNDSPWMDWAKYTDEGWYGDAAIRHFLQGHWRVPGDFNPAVAMPVWPLMEGVLFRVTGVSLVAARAMAVGTLVVSLFALYLLMERFPQRPPEPGKESLAAPLAVFLLAASPFVYAFGRMAVLEPPLAMFALLSLLVASHLRPGKIQFGTQLALGFLLVAMVLTKPTAATLLPGIGSMLWCRAGKRLTATLRLGLLPMLVALLFWASYLYVGVRPHYLEDYRYLFEANRYTSFQTSPLAQVLADTVANGTWMGGALVVVCAGSVLLWLLLRPAFFRNPLVGSCLLFLAGYCSFLAYHNSFQPRYYLVPVFPVTALAAYGIDELRFAKAGASYTPTWRSWSLLGVVLAIAVPDLSLQWRFMLEPQYTLLEAARNVSRIIRAEPGHSPLLLSISGSDISLMTGLPSINDDFGTLDLDARARLYRPGWFAAWNDLEDDKMDALTPAFRPVRVAAFPAMDDPERNLLILYRLDAVSPSAAQRERGHSAPRWQGAHGKGIMEAGPEQQGRGHHRGEHKEMHASRSKPN